MVGLDWFLQKMNSVDSKSLCSVKFGSAKYVSASSKLQFCVYRTKLTLETAMTDTVVTIAMFCHITHLVFAISKITATKDSLCSVILTQHC